jgi:hypothetical protein
MNNMPPLSELIARARRNQIVVGLDLQRLLGEAERLQEIDREQLKGKAKDWKIRLGNLDMMAGEMLSTPDAEALLAKAQAANLAINELRDSLNLAISGEVEVPIEVPIEEINTPVLHRPGVWITPVLQRAGSRKRELYKVPTGTGGVEWLGTVVPNGVRWDWCRHNSEVYDWDGERGGTEDTLEQAKAKVMEGWDSK